MADILGPHEAVIGAWILHPLGPRPVIPYKSPVLQLNAITLVIHLFP